MFESNRKMAVSGSIPSRLTGRVAIFQRVYNRGVYRVTLAVNGAVKASITNTKTKAGQTTVLNFDLNPAPSSKATAEQKKGKHMVWVPAGTESHIGGRWVEVPGGATEPGTLNVQKASGEQLQRQTQSMGGASSGR